MHTNTFCRVSPEVLDTLSIADVQVALRNTLKRWVEKK